MLIDSGAAQGASCTFTYTGCWVLCGLLWLDSLLFWLELAALERGVSCWVVWSITIHLWASSALSQSDTILVVAIGDGVGVLVYSSC